MADVTASGSDGQHRLLAVQRVEEQVGVTVERAIGDGAYGSGENRAACANYPDHPIDLVSPQTRPDDPEVDKSAFQIDLETKMATCPQAGRDETRRASEGATLLLLVVARGF